MYNTRHGRVIKQCINSRVKLRWCLFLSIMCVCIFPNFLNDIRAMNWSEEALPHVSIRLEWGCCNKQCEGQQCHYHGHNRRWMFMLELILKKNINSQFCFLQTYVLYDARVSIFFCQVSDKMHLQVFCLWITSCWSTRWIELFNTENLNNFHSYEGEVMVHYGHK